MANKYIKTKSKYILSKLHQNSNNGKIYERDWVTIGGVDPFATTQTPIYKSDNFIITVGNDSNSSKVFNSEEWETINGETNWTLDEINKNTNDEDTTDETYNNNQVKIDYYSLKDFAYFGSCSELIRASINNILSNFPGELYAHTYTVKQKQIYPTIYYDDKTKGISQDKIETKELGEGKLLLENPFNINLCDKSNSSDSINNFVKQYLNYQIIFNNLTYNINNISINRSDKPLCVGNLIYTIEITYNENESLYVYAYQGEDKIYYFVDKGKEHIHIRPKNKIYNDFLSSLDIFEKILLNTSTSPKYKASFEIISENDYGLKTEIKDFIFPIGNGGYNIGSNKAALEKYIQSLIDVSSYYDNVFCDNLYRSLTHESIKNFDWTFNKLNSDETETYQEGLDKITKIIRIFGRAFDDLKINIDNIKNLNNVTYDDVNNTSNDMLSSLCNMDGWDIIHVAPYEIKKTTENNIENEDSLIKYDFSRDYKTKYTPYYLSNSNGYFFPCGEENGVYNEDNLSYKIDEYTKKILYPIKVYSSDREYNINEIFIQFLKILKLNSKHIWKCKGTINGIKEILALFGLKYDRDFTVKEYTLLADPLIDNYRNDVNDYNINYINKTKTIQYSNDEFLNGENVDYIGLPVIYRDMNNKRYLYPYFNQYDSYDGNLYFQMKGGWMRKKPFIFTTDDYLLSTSDIDLYSETLNSLSIVSNIEELITIPKASLNNDDIYYVTNLNGKYVIVDGNLYNIETDTKGDYISVYVHSNSLQVGNTLFVGNITVSNGDNNEKKYDLNYLPNNYEIRIYVISINGNKTITVKSDDMTISSPFIYENGAMNNMNNPTHYFRLNNVEESGTIGSYGWEQLSDTNPTYLRIKLVKNYFNGNNPHYGHMAYDNGFDYILHFKQLFKYSCDNYLFDERYYNGDINQAVLQASEIGFDGLLKTDDLCDFNIESNANILEDTKIHFFKPRINNIEPNTDDKNYYAVSKNSISIINQYPTLNYVCHDSSCIKTEDGYINSWGINNSNFTGNTYISNVTDNSELDTYRIINTKWVDIIFYFTPNKDETNSIELFKYFDSVVTQYLSQILPTTAICTIKYEEKK